MKTWSWGISLALRNSDQLVLDQNAFNKTARALNYASKTQVIFYLTDFFNNNI